MMTIQDRITAQREIARNVCSLEGTNSPSCAVAWDVVEELQAEKSHQYQKALRSFERFCQEQPDALECLVYDN
jgi:hypothetical protein